jgi:hypothetical protein
MGGGMVGLCYELASPLCTFYFSSIFSEVLLLLSFFSKLQVTSLLGILP